MNSLLFLATLALLVLLRPVAELGTAILSTGSAASFPSLSDFSDVFKNE
jgi:hypothetical protein